MNTWRKILSWRSDIRAGDTVKVIASPELLKSIWIQMGYENYVREGYLKVESVNPTQDYGYTFVASPGPEYVGVVKASKGDNPQGWYFPYSHWRDFLEIVR